MLGSHSNVILETFSEIRQEPIWKIADGRYGMDRTHSPGTVWQLTRAPYAKKIMDAWQSDTVAEVVLRAGSKCGKTTPLLMCLAWSMKNRPVPKLWLSGDDQLAQDAAEEYIHPVFERCPDLAGTLLSDRIHKKLLRIRTLLCTLHIRGAKGETVLEQMSYGEILADEFRQFPSGSYMKLTKRQRNFLDAKRALFSTPNAFGDEFDARFLIGSQNEWMFPCEGCGDMIPIIFNPKYSQLPDAWRDKSMIMFPDGETCWLECHCNHRHFNISGTRRWIVDRGDWVPLNVSNNPKIRDPWVESFHWNAFLPPDLAWKPHVDEFRQAMNFCDNGYYEPLRIFVRETLGDSWREGTQFDKKEIGLSAFSIKDPVSADWQFIGLTVDVQQLSFWFTVFGWRKDGSARLLDCGEIFSESEIVEKQKEFGIRNPHFVFLDAAWSPKRRVHKLCAKYGWTALVGKDRPNFPHHDHRTNKTTFRLYSEKHRVDCGLGLHKSDQSKQRKLVCVFFYFSAPILVADRRQPAVHLVLVDDPAGELVHLDLVDPLVALEAEELVDPVDHAVGAALVGDGDAGRPAEQLRRCRRCCRSARPGAGRRRGCRRG